MQRGNSFGGICLSVCLSVIMITFENLYVESYFLVCMDYLEKIPVKFVYKGHRGSRSMSGQ